MEWIWVLGVCVAFTCTVIPGSAQNSSSIRPMYVISIPRALSPGTPTTLAITILTDSLVRVTAQLTHGNTSLAQTESTFQGGLTGVLTIPPIPEGFLSQSHPYTLMVKGFQGEKIIFTNATSLNLNPQSFNTFIQTDKPNYRPGETVKMRVLSLRQDAKPHKGRVDISIWDSKGDLSQRWLSLDSLLGIVSKEFQLSRTPPLGPWMIEAMVNEMTTEKQFVVDYYEPPHFKVLVRTSPDILVGDDISGTVTAQHSNGQPVHGTLSVTVTLVSTSYNSGHPFILNTTEEIHGSTQFFFSKDDLSALHQYSRTREPDDSMHYTDDDESIAVYVTACVTETSTGFKTNRTVTVHVMENKYHLEFCNFPHALKPSLLFSTQLKISSYDRKPLTSADRADSVLIEITQRTSKPRGQEQGESSNSSDSLLNRMKTEEDERKTLFLPVPEDGIVHIEFQLQDQVEMLVIQAQFMSSEETLEMYNGHVSPSGSYIQIHHVNSHPEQVGEPLHITVESTFQLTKLHYLVTARGQVVAAGTETSSFSLTPLLSWSPEACITVYCVLPDGEVINNAIHVPIDRVLRNNVSLSWSSGKSRPGDKVSLTVSVLEPGSLVGISVVGMGDEYSKFDSDIGEEVLGDMAEYVMAEMRPDHNGMTRDDPLSVFTACNLFVLTDTNLHKMEKSEELEMEDMEDRMTVQHWDDWRPILGSSKTWLWLDINISESTSTSLRVAVPDSITSWRATAFVMSDNLGLGLTSIPQKLTVSKDISLSLDLPPYITRGEDLVLEVNLFNYLQQEMEVIVMVAESELFEFILAAQGDVSMVNTRMVTVGSQDGASVLFPIRPLVLGEMEISVNAFSSEASDNIVRKMLVKSEGVEQSFSETLFLELAPSEWNLSRVIPLSFPPDVVPGSKRAHVAVVGDILGPSITGLGLLVQIPYGCGEQNMINFAPNVYVLQYLDTTPQANKEIRNRALMYMMEGYQRELSYQRDDGSFSAFGTSDTSGSTWLTAFVLRCFLQARPFIQIDQTVLSRAMGWLVRQQGPQGEFTEAGRVIHTELQGGLEDGPVSLTAYVLMALLEDQTYVGMFTGNVSLASKYLEDRVASGVSTNYSLCLVAYALSLANSPVAGTALAELTRRADMSDGVMTWRSSGGEVLDGWQPRSVEIEMAAYVLLSLFRRASVVEGIALMKWLSQQRNHLGGFGTTQDTVIALQALSSYAMFSGADAIDLSIKVSTSASRSVSHFNINSTNYLLHQSTEIDAETDLLIDVFMEGRGFALFQIHMFYNVKIRVLSERHHDATDHEAFSLDVDVLDDMEDLDHVLLSICTRLLESQRIAQTGMVLVDVGMLSGFTLAPEAVAMGDLVRKVETSAGKVSLYLDSLTTSEVCIMFPMIRDFKVAQVQDAVVQVYDYYEPRRRAVRSYNSVLMHSMGYCAFCERYCSRCGGGIIISSSSTTHLKNSALYSVGCLLAAITSFLL